MKLYYNPLSTYSQKVLIACYEKGITFERTPRTRATNIIDKIGVEVELYYPQHYLDDIEHMEGRSEDRYYAKYEEVRNEYYENEEYNRDFFQDTWKGTARWRSFDKDKLIKDYIRSTDSYKKQIEADVREIAGIEDDEVPVFLDFESVKIVKPGKYLLDLTKLFENNKPKIYTLEEGKYIIDLSSKTGTKFSS